MDAELTKRLHATRLTQGEVRALAGHLPPTDEELHQLIESLVTAADEDGVPALMFAMVAGGRRIEARVLPGVLPLLKELNAVVVVALQARGEVAEKLMAAIESGILGWEREAVLLLIAGWICVQGDPERELPSHLIPKARSLARDVRGGWEASLPLFALAQITGDQGLQKVLEDLIPPPPPGVIQTTLEYLIERPAADPLGGLPEQMDRVLASGAPLRRAVAKVGRNDPCPCGSGKKYKKCCFEKDQERLHHSSEIAGITTEELEAMPEPFLTREKIEEMRGPKLARLRIEMLAPALQATLLERLAVFQQTDALLAAWEKVPWRADLFSAWDHCVFEMAQSGRRDAVERLMALHRPPADQEDAPLNARLLLLRDRPEEFLRLIEEVLLRSLEEPNNLDYVDAACSLAEGHLPGLGTFVARGAACIASPIDAEILFESIAKVRDQLNLPPEDPGEWMLDRLFEMPEELDEQTREDLATARRQMDAAAAEATRLRTQLTETRVQLERQERLAVRNKPASATTVVPAQASDAALAELRHRIDELKTALKQRHTERNALRRELREVLKEKADFQNPPAKVLPDTAAAVAVDCEEEALLESEQTPLQTVRLPVFPGRFAQTLESFPTNVARSALRLIGELAAGEPSAFVGVRRLRLRHDVCRARVAKDYRLFFKLQPATLEILDMINRRDFEKWLKTLG
ncbi:MAG: SEC-C domain-containing protein [Verrucomicrobia bacterium]|jgi:hypothetical protein|nr:SEC-C domain-containing protein [Verrucomicrobiota bacterium]